MNEQPNPDAAIAYVTRHRQFVNIERFWDNSFAIRWNAPNGNARVEIGPLDAVVILVAEILRSSDEWLAAREAAR